MFINSRLYAIKGGQRVKTGSKEEVEFQGLGGRKVVGQFDGGRIITDAGTLLLGEAEHARGFLGDFSKCFTDYRNQDAIEHTVEELVSQRIYGIALGYEDLNDHDQLRIDPLLATLCKKQDPTGQQRRCRDNMRFGCDRRSDTGESGGAVFSWILWRVLLCAVVYILWGSCAVCEVKDIVDSETYS